jgi:hypothetical protein
MRTFPRRRASGRLVSGKCLGSARLRRGRSTLSLVLMTVQRAPTAIPPALDFVASVDASVVSLDRRMPRGDLRGNRG